MSLNGAGIGIVRIPAVLRRILGVLLLALTVCYAGGVGAVRLRSRVQPFGTSALLRIGAATSASGWCAPELPPVVLPASGSTCASRSLQQANSGLHPYLKLVTAGLPPAGLHALRAPCNQQITVYTPAKNSSPLGFERSITPKAGMSC